MTVARSHQYMVAIVGRPNVGKSTLFNKLIGKRQAILSEIPGTTRDVLFGTVSWQGHSFTVADTAGIEPDAKSDLAEDIKLQTKAAIESADLIFFMVNAREGLLPDDLTAAEMIRKSGKPAILLINKTDYKSAEANIPEFYRLGFTTHFETAGTSGKGIGELLDETVERLKNIPVVPDDDDTEIIRVAIVGRPNVGKSTLFNKLIGKKRSVVSEAAGTTRDVVNESTEYEGYRIEIIDTAGLRKRGKVQWGIEKYSALRMVKSIQEADIVLLVMEGQEGVAAQDMHIMQSIIEASRSPIFIVNKWDLVEKTHTITSDYEDYLRQKYKFASWIPAMFVSALTGQRVNKIKDLILSIWRSRNLTLPEADLKNIIAKAILNRPPIGRRIRPVISSYRQVATNPPLIQLTVDRPDSIHFTYLRYLDNQIRKAFPLMGVPIQFSLKAKPKSSKNR